MNIGGWISNLVKLLGYLPRTTVLSVVGPACLLVLGYIAWSYYGANKLDKTYYSLRQENLKVTPQPAWIPLSVAEEVFQGSMLQEVSLLNGQAAETIAHAFNMHPWVRRTTRVTKLSGGEVQVDLEFRRPVAMVLLDVDSPLMQTTPSVESASQVSKSNPANRKFLAIDEEGVLLPYPQDSKIRSQDFLFIFVAPKGASTRKLAGQRFEDARVLSAVRLCTLLEPYRQPLRLESIYVYRDTSLTGPAQSILEIVTQERDGKEQRVKWGHAPGEEIPQEAKLERKLSQLLEVLQAGAAFAGADVSGI